MIILKRTVSYEVHPEDNSNYITSFDPTTGNFLEFIAYKSLFVPIEGHSEEEIWETYKEITPEQFNTYTTLKNLVLKSNFELQEKLNSI